jgi:NAD+-dependent secondary alcohol dehydrogenase Adh1
VKAVRVHAYDEPPVIEDVPEPAIEGPLDVVVEVGGAGLCRTDLHVIEGQ